MLAGTIHGSVATRIKTTVLVSRGNGIRPLHFPSLMISMARIVIHVVYVEYCREAKYPRLFSKGGATFCSLYFFAHIIIVVFTLKLCHHGPGK